MRKSFFRLTLCIILIFGMIHIDHVSANSFSDVNNDDYYADSVAELSNIGILSGYDDGTFRADRTISRAEMVSIICRLLRIEADIVINDYVFSDVVDHWAEKYINVATAREIVNGYEDGSFKPDKYVLCEEAVKMLSVASGMDAVSNVTSDWSLPYFDYAEFHGILENSQAKKGENIRRGDIAVMVYNVLHKNDSQIRIVNGLSPDSIIDDKYTTIFNSETFKQSSSVSDVDMSVIFPVNTSVKKDDLLLLKFAARASDRSGKINITINENEFSGTYAINVYKTDYYIPIKEITDIQDLKICLVTEKQPIILGDFELVNYADEDVEQLKTGMYDISPINRLDELTDADSNKQNATDIETDGSYVYAIGSGELKIYKDENKMPVEIASVDGLGDVRDIDISEDGKALAIAARKNGFFMIDISDVEHPYIASHTPTLELATGGLIDGNYYFVCSRYCGIEVFDISDISSPKWCSQASGTEEYFGCSIENGYIYIVSWNPGRVSIYDINDVYNPQKVGFINLNGTGSDCVVRDNVLYVVTGYHSQDKKDKNTDPGYGMGNGLEIFDVSNPKKPTKLSEVRIDGRLTGGKIDHWRVKVAGSYAYVTNAHAGTMIVDVSSPKAPNKIRTIVGAIGKMPDNNTDSKKYKMACFSNSAVMDGAMYISSVDNGLYRYEFEGAEYEKRKSHDIKGTSAYYDETVPDIKGYDVKKYRIQGSVYTIQKHGDFYFCACGEEGIRVLNDQIVPVNNVKTQQGVTDIKLMDDYLISAESGAGLGIYKINNDKLELVGRCNVPHITYGFSNISVFPDHQHVMVEGGFTKLVIVNIKDVTNPVIDNIISTATMYSRNLSNGLVEGKFIGQFDRDKMNWYCVNDNNEVYLYSELESVTKGQANGVAAYGDYAIAVYNNGYIFYKPSDLGDAKLSSLPVIRIPGVKTMQGKPSAFGNILVVSNIQGKRAVIADISKLDSPALIADIEFAGNPDVACFCDGEIFIPLRRGGLLRISKEM